MKKLFFCLFTFIFLGFSFNSQAAEVTLTHFDDTTYILEFTKNDKDTNKTLLKEIAKEVQKKGYTNFLMPSITDVKSDTNIMLTNADQKEITILAEIYHLQAYNVKNILEM